MDCKAMFLLLKYPGIKPGKSGMFIMLIISQHKRNLKWQYIRYLFPNLNDDVLGRILNYS